MELTADNVETVFMDCLFDKGEDTSNAVIADGVLSKLGFNPNRLEKHKIEIKELLSNLPDSFKTSGGGGMSFLNACVDKNGEQWGEHRNIEQLLVLGVATKQAKVLLPREHWNNLPGGMPYFCVITE